jgi:hypothetical protein
MDIVGMHHSVFILLSVSVHSVFIHSSNFSEGICLFILFAEVARSALYLVLYTHFSL